MEREKVNQWPGQFKDSLFCEAQCEEFGCWCLSPWVWWEWWAEIPAETWILLGLWDRAHLCPQEASLCPSRSCLKHISVSSWRPWESHDHLYLVYHNFCQILIIMIKVCLAPFIKAINKTLLDKIILSHFYSDFHWSELSQFWSLFTILQCHLSVSSKGTFPKCFQISSHFNEHLKGSLKYL